MAGRFDRYWEMIQGGPRGFQQEVFRCTCCNAVTVPEAGHDGEPDPANCSARCREAQVRVAPESSRARFYRNFERTFPGSPGHGI